MELAVTKRDIAVKPKALREKGMLPAVLYGRAQEATPISVERKAFDKLFRTAGESTVITLSGLGEEKDALIHEVTVDPVSGVSIHADFYAIAKGQTVTVSIPLEFDGESPAVKDLGGILVKVMHEIEIECQPKDLPHAIHVDISKLATLEDQIHVKDLADIPASAKITVDPEEVVAMIDVAKEEPVEEAPADLSAIEISEERGKKEEEGEAGAAEAETKE
ncbi:MAG TPA: 50S ribosomal protein L25 [Candidatus Paceibacterota bacterium]|nr:50S ribosomal protein L25 [Candidatus Paceibacterota bacterium]